MQGQVSRGDPGAWFSGAVLDSRRVRGGELFFALPGERTDGHRFVADALERGAAAAVVGRSPQQPLPAVGGLIRVQDTYEALHDLTRHVRRQVPEELVAVTGSVGKTTTKDLLARMLGERYRTAANPGNLNNLLGFPVALLDVPDDTQWMVAEMGMSEPGELSRLSRLGRPDAVVLTNVRPAHLGSFRSLRDIAEAKAEIFAGLAPAGSVVANAEDPEVVRITQRHVASSGGDVCWFAPQGRSPLPTPLRIAELECPRAAQPGSRFLLAAEGETVGVSLNLPGLHNVENCLAAATAAFALGVPLQAIARAAGAATAAPMRGVVHDLGEGTQLFDDSYNSNPDALAKALRAAAELPGRRHWAVLGEMLELGPEAPRFHREAGALAARLGFDLVVGVGELAHELVDAARGAGTEATWTCGADEAAQLAVQEITPGDLVLVKGSRGVGLEIVVRRLLECR